MKQLSKLISNMKPSGIREFFNYASEKPDIVSLSVGEPDFVTPKKIRDAAKRSLDEFKSKCYLIITDRYNSSLEDVIDKVYTRNTLL